MKIPEPKVTCPPKSAPGKIAPTFTLIVAWHRYPTKQIIENDQHVDGPTGTGPLVSGPDGRSRLDAGRTRLPHRQDRAPDHRANRPADISVVFLDWRRSRRIRCRVIDDDQRQSKDAFLAEKSGHFGHFTAPWHCPAGIYQAKSTRKPNTPPSRHTPHPNSRLIALHPCTVPEGARGGLKPHTPAGRPSPACPVRSDYGPHGSHHHSSVGCYGCRSHPDPQACPVVARQQVRFESGGSEELWPELRHCSLAIS